MTELALASAKEGIMMRQGSTGPFVVLVPTLFWGVANSTSVTLTQGRDSHMPPVNVVMFADATMGEQAMSQFGIGKKDLCEDGMTVTELSMWGRSMMGGDTSDMLDI